MKISELVDELEKIKSENGDIRCGSVCNQGFLRHIEVFITTVGTFHASETGNGFNDPKEVIVEITQNQ